MAVYLFTYHAYRSWNADHRRGYTRKDEGVLPPDEERAEFYDRNAKQPAVEFDRTMQAFLIAGAADVCRHRDWRFQAAVVLMLAMILVYVFTNDLSHWPGRKHSIQPTPAANAP